MFFELPVDFGLTDYNNPLEPTLNVNVAVAGSVPPVQLAAGGYKRYLSLSYFDPFRRSEPI